MATWVNHTPYAKQIRWFNNKGWSGSLEYMINRHFMDLTGKTGTTGDLINFRMQQLGHTTGTTRDKLNRFFIVKTLGLVGSNPDTTEKKFFDNLNANFT